MRIIGNVQVNKDKQQHGGREMKALGMVAAVIVLGLLMYVVSKYVWVIIGISVVLVVCMMVANHAYKRLFNKDMSWYTRMFK